MSQLLDALLRRLSRLDRPVCVAFSGGMDSLLVALCARKFAPARCIVVGAPASDDVWHARRLKARFDLNLAVVELDSRRFARHARLVAPRLEPANPMTLNLSTVVSCVAEAAGDSTVLTGMGADELFLGYRKYGGEGAPADPASDLRRLVEVDVPRYGAIGARFGARFIHPFLDVAGDVPRAEGLGKPEVRAALEAMGVPATLIREKRAMQFGSGASQLLRGLSRAEGLSENGLVLHYMEDKRGKLI